MDVHPKSFVKIILAVKWLARHSSKFPNQQWRPLPSLLTLSFFYAIRQRVSWNKPHVLLYTVFKVIYLKQKNTFDSHPSCNALNLWLLYLCFYFHCMYSLCNIYVDYLQTLQLAGWRVLCLSAPPPPPVPPSSSPSAGVTARPMTTSVC